MATVMLFLQQTTGKTERHTHFCMPLEPVFTRDCGGRVHFTDEPTGNLDSKTGGKVFRLLLDVCKRFDQTLLIVTHNEMLAREADTIIRVVDGTAVTQK